MNCMISYDWPGNVRELENVVERTIILCHNKPLSFSEFITSESKDLKKAENNMLEDDHYPEDSQNLDAAMAIHIKKAMTLAKGKGGAAELLETNPRTLRYRMRKLGVPFGREATQSKNIKER